MTKRFPLTLLLAASLLSLLVACAPDSGPTDEPLQPTVAGETVVPEPTEPAATSTVEPSPTAETEPPTDPTSATLEEFTSDLMLAIDSRDTGAMQAAMSDPFAVGYWLSEGVSYSPAEAAEFLTTSLLPEGAQLHWADPATHLSEIIPDQVPESFLGPDKKVVATLLSYGWGEDGTDEAIQFITEQPDGSYRWDITLYSGFGFAGWPTDVEAVLINADEATFYSGPGENFESVATVFGGQTYPVTGVSQDELWWRLLCFDDNNVLIPQCWVSADEAVSSPTAAP